MICRRLSVLGILILTAVAPYSRSQFGGWQDTDHDCQDTRAELLIQRSLVPVTFTSDKRCYVADGLWVDAYSMTLERDPSRLDVDHVVPLANAWKAGADQWTIAQRADFANDPDELVITSLHINRSKGDRAPDEWLPENEVAKCIYLYRWKRIKEKYDLSSTSKEEIALESCQLK